MLGGTSSVFPYKARTTYVIFKEGEGALSSTSRVSFESANHNIKNDITKIIKLWLEKKQKCVQE